MKIYFDVFTGDELCSDSYPMKLVDDLYYEFEGKVRIKKGPKVKYLITNSLEYHGKQRY